MGRLRRTMRMERLESRSLLAAALGIADIVIDQTAGEPQVATSVEINNAAGIRAATVEILYDQELLQADLASVRAGSIWEGKGVAIANLNDEGGKITAFIFASEDMNLSSGSLLDIDFVFNEDSPGNARAHVGLGSVRLNEGDIPISAAPIPGQATIGGSITRRSGPTPTDTSASANSPQRPAPLRPTLPLRPVGQPTPQPTAPPQQLGLPLGVAPVAAANVTSPRFPSQSSGPTAAENQPTSSQGHTDNHCAPITAAGRVSSQDLHAASSYSAPLTAIDQLSADDWEQVTELVGPPAPTDPNTGDGSALALPLLSPLTEQPAVATNQAVAGPPEAALADRAKQAPGADDTPKRPMLPPRPVSLYGGSANPSRSGGFGTLLWLLSQRQPTVQPSDHDGQGD